jgi:hypothetical protein
MATVDEDKVKKLIKDITLRLETLHDPNMYVKMTFSEIYRLIDRTDITSEEQDS